MDQDSCPSCGTPLDQMLNSPTSSLCPDAFVPNRSKQRQRDSPLLSKKSLRPFLDGNTSRGDLTDLAKTTGQNEDTLHHRLRRAFRKHL